MNITPDTVYWLLSTAAQVYAALIAVFGALAIYRLQIASNFRRSLREQLINLYILCHVNLNPYHLSIKELIETWEKYSQEKKKVLREKDKENYGSIENSVSTLEGSVRHSKWIRRSTVTMTFVFFIFIATSLYGMFYTCQLAANRSFLVGATLVTIFLTLILMSFHIWVVLLDEQKLVKRRC